MVKIGSWKELFKNLRRNRAHLDSEGFREEAASELALEGQAEVVQHKEVREVSGIPRQGTAGASWLV